MRGRKNINEKMYEKPYFQGLRKNLLHFFICVILIGLQVVGMNFRNEDSECFQILRLCSE